MGPARGNVVSGEENTPRRRGRPPRSSGGLAAGAAEGPGGGAARDAGKDRQFVTALARGLKILQCFDEAHPELSGSQIAKMTGFPQPTVWRLCHTLLELDMLAHVGNERLRPGLPVLRLGYSAISGLDVIDLARPQMQEIASAYGAACGLGVRNDFDMIFVERCEGKNQLLMNLRVGSAVPLVSSALGWAHIAGHDAPARRRIIQDICAHDPEGYEKTKSNFQAALLFYDKAGYILNEGVFHKAYNTVAVPVAGPDGAVPYVLNCGSPTASLSTATLRQEIAPRLIALARMLESVLAAKTTTGINRP